MPVFTCTFIYSDVIFFNGKYSTSSTKSTRVHVFFRAERKTNMAALSESEWLRHIRHPFKTEFDQTWQEASTQCLLRTSKFVFFGPIQKQRWPPLSLIGWVIFKFSSSIACGAEFDETWHEASIQCPLPSLWVFCWGGGGDRKQICRSYQLYVMPYYCRLASRLCLISYY